MSGSGVVGAVFLGCLLGAGFLSSVEVALVGVTESRVRFALENDVVGAARLHYWLERSERILITLRFALLLCISGVPLALWSWFSFLGSPSGRFLLTCGLGALVLMLSQLAVRSVTKHYSLGWALRTLVVVRALVAVFLPVVVVCEAVSRLFRRLVGHTGDAPGAFWTAQGLEKAAVDARVTLIGEPGEQLMESIISFSDTVIREIMVPRTEMIALPGNVSEEELRRVLLEAGHSRIPVFDETVDNILGVLHVKDFFMGGLREGGGTAQVRELVRPSFYVPEVMKISELLREFQRRKTHLAIVVDEYGGTAGVVTLEDIIEEIVGEIQDEYDVDEKQFRAVHDNKLIADGRVHLSDLEELWDLSFPEDGAYETLAGFLVSQAGYLPEAGTSVRWANLVFTIKEANEKRIETVEVERKDWSGKQPSPV